MTRRFWLTGALTAAALTLSVAGCKSSGSGHEPITLNGADSTFAYPLYSAWSSEFAKLHPGLQINYQSIGSGGGIRQVSEGTVDFGATDGPMNDQHLPSLIGVSPRHMKEDTKTVQELMRHASSKITMDVYTHGDEETKRLALTHTSAIFALAATTGKS
jgi:hypothetical protein